MVLSLAIYVIKKMSYSARVWLQSSGLTAHDSMEKHFYFIKLHYVLEYFLPVLKYPDP